MDKDETARQAVQPLTPALAATEAMSSNTTSLERPSLDPHTAAVNTCWEAFEEADYENRIAIYNEILDKPELIDGELAFYILNNLNIDTYEHNQCDRFDSLVEALRMSQPDIYAENAHFCLNWRICNALVMDRYDTLPSLVWEFAAIASQDIDIFNQTLDQLGYYGQLSLLVDAMRIAWPQIKTSSDVVPWGIEEFSLKAMNFVIFDYCEHQLVSDATNSDLNRLLEFYHDVDSKRLVRYLALLTGQAPQTWGIEDFLFQHQQARSEDRFDDEDEVLPRDVARQRLFDLSIEFLGYLRREEDIPYTRGELARGEIYRYTLDRFDGRLEPQETSFLIPQRRRGKRRPKRQPRHPVHQLCPDYATLDRHLGNLIGFFNMQWYKAGATLELIPAWLRFLLSRRLIDNAQHTKTLEELQPLVAAMGEMWESSTEDPALFLGLQKAWSGQFSGLSDG